MIELRTYPLVQPKETVVKRALNGVNGASLATFAVTAAAAFDAFLGNDPRVVRNATIAAVSGFAGAASVSPSEQIFDGTENGRGRGKRAVATATVVGLVTAASTGSVKDGLKAAASYAIGTGTARARSLLR
jgi:hypothetical protein